MVLNLLSPGSNYIGLDECATVGDGTEFQAVLILCANSIKLGAGVMRYAAERNTARSVESLGRISVMPDLTLLSCNDVLDTA